MSLIGSLCLDELNFSFIYLTKPFSFSALKRTKFKCFPLPKRFEQRKNLSCHKVSLNNTHVHHKGTIVNLVQFDHDFVFKVLRRVSFMLIDLKNSAQILDNLINYLMKAIQFIQCCAEYEIRFALMYNNYLALRIYY